LSLLEVGIVGLLPCFILIFVCFYTVFTAIFVKRFHFFEHKFYTYSPTKSALYVVFSLLRIASFLSFRGLVLFKAFSLKRLRFLIVKFKVNVCFVLYM